MNMNEQRKTYRQILIELQSTLESGDVVEDIEDMPSAVTTLFIISDIINNALSGLAAWDSIAHIFKEE